MSIQFTAPPAPSAMPRSSCGTTIESDVKSLCQVSMFGGIDPARLKLLAFTSERMQYVAGQRFFSKGDPSDAAYFILEGRVRVTLDEPEGERVLAELGPGACVGEMGVLGDHKRSATIVAAEDTTVLRTDRTIFLELLEHFPKMAMAIMRELAMRLERTNVRPKIGA